VPTRQFRQVFCVSASTGSCATAKQCGAVTKPQTSKACATATENSPALSLSKALTCDFTNEKACHWQNGFYAFPHTMRSDIPFTLMAGNHYEEFSPQGSVEALQGDTTSSHLGYLFFNTKHLSAVKKTNEKAHWVSPAFVPEAGQCLVFSHHMYGSLGELSLEATSCPNGQNVAQSWERMWNSVDAGVNSENRWRQVEIRLDDIWDTSGTAGGAAAAGNDIWSTFNRRKLRHNSEKSEHRRNLFWTQDLVTTAPAANPQVWGNSGDANQILSQLRFTAVVGADPSRSDLGLDNIRVQPCSAAAVSGNRGRSRAIRTAPAPKIPIEPAAKIPKTQPGIQCVFPFVFEGKRFDECTSSADPDGKQWCSTKVDAQGNHEKGHWSYAPCEIDASSDIWSSL